MVRRRRKKKMAQAQPPEVVAIKHGDAVGGSEVDRVSGVGDPVDPHGATADGGPKFDEILPDDSSGFAADDQRQRTLRSAEPVVSSNHTTANDVGRSVGQPQCPDGDCESPPEVKIVVSSPEHRPAEEQRCLPETVEPTALSEKPSRLAPLAECEANVSSEDETAPSCRPCRTDGSKAADFVCETRDTMSSILANVVPSDIDDRNGENAIDGKEDATIVISEVILDVNDVIPDISAVAPDVNGVPEDDPEGTADDNAVTAADKDITAADNDVIVTTNDLIVTTDDLIVTTNGLIVTTDGANVSINDETAADNDATAADNNVTVVINDIIVSTNGATASINDVTVATNDVFASSNDATAADNDATAVTESTSDVNAFTNEDAASADSVTVSTNDITAATGGSEIDDLIATTDDANITIDDPKLSLSGAEPVVTDENGTSGTGLLATGEAGVSFGCQDSNESTSDGPTPAVKEASSPAIGADDDGDGCASAVDPFERDLPPEPQTDDAACPLGEQQPPYDVPKSLKEVEGLPDEQDEQLVYDLPSGDVDACESAPIPNGSVATLADGENVYEEIKRRDTGSSADGGVNVAVEPDDPPALFKRSSLVEEVMSEVERVQQRHNQTLQELNLDIENLIMPAATTPTVSPLTPAPTVAPQPPPGVAVVDCSQRRPPVPPHATVPVGSSTPLEAKNHMLSTRTLPPLPGDSSEPTAMRYPGYSYRRKAPSQRDLFKSKSVPANTSAPTGQTPPSGVKQWLSRLPSLSSFRESKAQTGVGVGVGVGGGVGGAALSGTTNKYRWSMGVAEEPVYMLYDDTYRLHEVTKPFPEDDIYEDIDRDKMPVGTPYFASTLSMNTSGIGEKRSNCSSECCEDNSDNESIRSSGNMSVASFKGRIMNIGRKLSRQHDEKVKISRPTEVKEIKPEGKLTRLFSKRKGYDMGRGKTGTVPDDIVDGNMPKLRMTNRNHFPMLPPPPTGLNPDQIKRRCIVTTLVQSENSYVASLKKLVLEYKKPLEDNSPSILSASKIATLFFRVPEILQCHNNFCITLAACIRRWDKEEKMGEVFISAFSKASVLDIYSDYINNFSTAMELAKLEAKRKSVFTDFLKVKQITSPDRLSFFGLMVKPVQRFPQFILLLQDLLRHTPQGHHDRMALQLALTQMETLADMLNERKRETDQAHAVKDILRHVGSKPSARSLGEGVRYLLRQDTLSHLIFNQNGQWIDSKARKLYVMNDLIVCVTAGPSATTKGRNKSERMSIKWAVPITDVEVQEDASPILNRMVHAMTAGQTSATKTDKMSGSKQIEGVQSIYHELNDLIHDFEVTSRISALVSTLKREYPELSVDVVQGLSHSIQQLIQKKDEEVKWIDSCCLQFSVPLKTKTGKLQKELLIFQSGSMDTKQEWLTDVRLAQLALDINNSPAWDIPELDRRPSNKIPLFVKAVSVYSSQDHTEVKCGCYHTTMSNRLLGRRRQDYVWLCSSDGVNSHISVHTLRQMGLRDVFSFDMPECRISSMESVPAVDTPSSETGLRGDTVWMGTESRRILVYCGSDAEHYQEIGSAQMTASVLHIKYHSGQVFVGLANGTVAIFFRNNRGYWQMKDFMIVTLGTDPVTCLLPVNSSMFCASGHKVCVLNAATGKVVHNHSVHHDHMGSVYTMAHSGIGLWLNLRNTPLICLYHAETFQHLQDINITSSIRRVLAEQNRPHTPRCYCVTTLSTSVGLLWIGTNVGVSLSIPLPRLQGMPILGRRANMSYHANVGPVTMILVLQTPAVVGSELTQSAPPTEAETAAESRSGPPAGVPFHTPNAAAYSQAFRSSRVAPRGESPMGVMGMAKTLPRSWKLPKADSGDSDCNVYGLYGNLLNVREGSGDLENPTEDDLRRSNPDLIPSLVGTLDRRVRLNSGRPRSLDLANLSGLHHEFNCVSSSSEDGGSGSQSLAELPEYPYGGAIPERESCANVAARSVSFRSTGSSETSELSGTIAEVAVESPPGTNNPPTTASAPTAAASPTTKTPTVSSQPAQRSVLTLIGGRGYVDLRKAKIGKSKDGPQPNPVFNTNDAYAIFWEMKV